MTKLTKENMANAKPAVLAVIIQCECNCVNVSVSRAGIDKLSHGGFSVVTCPHCDREFIVRAVSEGHAVVMLPKILPGEKVGVFVHRSGDSLS